MYDVLVSFDSFQVKDIAGYGNFLMSAGSLVGYIDI